MVIDVRRRCPVLANTVGGVSGAAIRPIALRAVWQLAELGCSIVAVGGVSTGEHVAQMMMAGATAVQVGNVPRRRRIFWNHSYCGRVFNFFARRGI